MSTGFAKALDMEPGMRFRRALGQGELTFAYLDPIGGSRFTDKRRVRVTVEGGHRFNCEWDTLLVLIDDD